MIRSKKWGKTGGCFRSLKGGVVSGKKQVSLLTAKLPGSHPQWGEPEDFPLSETGHSSSAIHRTFSSNTRKWCYPQQGMSCPLYQQGMTHMLLSFFCFNLDKTYEE